MASKTSYIIKHNYLFEDEDTIVNIPTYNEFIIKCDKLFLSDIMKASKQSNFDKIMKNKSKNIVLIDDIGNCINPQSEKYKLFIIRCVYRKLSKLGFNIFI